MTKSNFVVLCLLFYNGFHACLSQNIVTVHFNTSSLTVNEGNYADIQLVVQGEFDQNFSVKLLFRDGTARFGHHYYYDHDIMTLVTFYPGSSSSSVFRVGTIANNCWEGTKSFQIKFEPPPDLDLHISLQSGERGTLNVNIHDRDSVHISFQTPILTVTEDSEKVELGLQSIGMYCRSFSASFSCIPVNPVEAKNGDDFKGGVYSVLFQKFTENNTISSTAKIPIFNDFTSELTESFICVILTPQIESGIMAGCPNTISIEIEDDDVIEVSFESAIYSGEEGGTTSEIRLKATHFEEPFYIQISAVPLDFRRPEKDYEAEFAIDYTDPRTLVEGGVVQFDPSNGLLSTPLFIPLLSDNITEGTEYFGLSFVALTGDSNPVVVKPGDLHQALVAIQDTLTVHFNTPTLTVVEGSDIDIQLVAQRMFYQNFTVKLLFGDETARFNSDYLYNASMKPSVTFTPGSMLSSVFRVIAIPDNVWEGTRSFQVRFKLLTDQDLNFSLESGRLDTLRVYIQDDDSVHISFQTSHLTVREDSESVHVQLLSRGLYGRNFSVSFACIPIFPVEAKDGNDFTGGTFTAQFGDLQCPSSLSSAKIPILNDFITESTESFSCLLLRPREEEGIVVECPSIITITIEDDDVIKMGFEKKLYFGEEGEFTGITLRATYYERPLSARIFVVGLDSIGPEKEMAATISVDYTDPRSLSGGGVVEFDHALGLLSTCLHIPLLPDNITEGTEYFGLSFVPLIHIGDHMLITPVDPIQAIVAINDTNEILVRFNSSNFEIDEDASSLDVYFEVVREVSPGVYVPAEYTFDFQLQVTTITVVGSATANVDFEETVDLVTFSAGEEFSTPFSVKITDDTLCEGPEQFNVSYSINSSSVRSGANVRQLDTTATVVIKDNDEILVRFNSSNLEIAEDASSLDVYFEVVREVAPRVYVPAEYTFDFQIQVMTITVGGLATANVDFEETVGSVTFSAGQQFSTPFPVKITDDTLCEGPEQFTVSYSINSSSFRRGANVRQLDTTATVVINDNDANIVHTSFQTSRQTVREDSTSVQLQLQSSGGYGRKFSMSFTCIPVFPVEAKDEDDFTTGVHTVQFGENQTVSSTAEIAIVDDSLPECTESFICVILRTTGESCIGTRDPDTITVVIEDDDEPFIRFVSTSIAGVEGEVASLSVNRTGSITRNINCTVNVRTGPTTAVAGVDYRLFTHSIEFKRQNTAFEEKTIYLQLLEDNLSEGKECFRVVLECRPKDLTGCYPPTATVCIQGN